MKAKFNFFLFSDLFSSLSYFNFLDYINLTGLNRFFFGLTLNNLNKKFSYRLFLSVKVFSKLSLLKFNSFCDVLVVDNAKQFLFFKNRFSVQFLFLSIVFEYRICVKTFWDFKMFLKSFSNLFLGSGWGERESFDMFGVLFNGHVDLRRILNDYGFDGFPGQKFFPVYGFKEVLFCEETNSIIYLNVCFAQRYRDFYLSRSWGN